MIPGEIITKAGDIELNVGVERSVLAVSNTGDRPIQVGSHYHFFEVNQALHFDRELARGLRHCAVGPVDIIGQADHDQRRLPLAQQGRDRFPAGSAAARVHGLEIVLVDERYSSREAEARLKSARESGIRRRRVAKADVDAAAACVILERWFSEVT